MNLTSTTRLILGCVLTMTFDCAPKVASAQPPQFYTFAQWEMLNPQMRDAYIAGAIDAMLAQGNYPPGVKALNDRYSQCLYRSKISPAQLSKGTLARATEKPSIRSGSVLFALTGFINDMCPDLLGADALGRLFALPPEESAKTPGEK
jgi:hypothetical protein